MSENQNKTIKLLSDTPDFEADFAENQNEIIDYGKIELTEIELLDKKRKINLEKLFTLQGMDLIITEIQKEVADFSADITTKKGRAEIISMAAKVAKCKSPIKNLASELKEESRKLIDGVNAQWNRYEAAMDDLRDKIRKPVDEIEEREAAQLKACQDRLSQIESLKDCGSTPQAWSSVIMNCEIGITNVKDFLENFEWGQFKFRAETAANEVLEILNLRCSHAKEQKIKDDELDKLRKEAAERAQKDHEERIAREAAEKAKREAEEVAERERQASIEREAKIEADKKAAEQAQINAEIRAKEAERLGKEQAEQAELAKIAAEKKAKEDAKKAAQEAVEKERLRVEEEARKEKEAAEKREANKKHRAKINNEAKSSLFQVLVESNFDTSNAHDLAKSIIEAIAKDEITHVRITY